MKLFLLGILTVFQTAQANVVFQAPVTKSVTTTGTQFLPQNAFRNYLQCQNNGSANVILRTDSIPASANDGIQIPPGNWVLEYSAGNAPVNPIYAKSVSGTNQVTCIEGD